ncbi:MAG: MotA/TolQ/ExbB proton channel family protein [Planctomycetaceae bacterium]|nr:MotA/TolQ/ExbB proton channel family protein [Planctomycetaceae bacterium]
MLEQLEQIRERIGGLLPPWDEVLLLLSKHFVEVILVVAVLEAFLALIVFSYNRRYLRKVDRWFRNDVLRECSKPSSLLSRWLQVEHLLHTFRVEYVKKLDGKSQESLKEEYYKLTNEKTHSVYAYSKGVRTFFNLFFDLIPMFPMLGILGTVVAIACQFNAATETSEGVEAVLSVTENFGMAIWTTIYGIVFAIGFTAVNAMFIEAGAQKCFELEKTAQQSLDEVLHIIASRWSTGGEVAHHPKNPPLPQQADAGGTS